MSCLQILPEALLKYGIKIATGREEKRCTLKALSLDPKQQKLFKVLGFFAPTNSIY